MPDPLPLRLEIRRQFGCLQFSLEPVGAPVRWREAGSSRESLAEALHAAWSTRSLAPGQSVTFRGDAYLNRDHLIMTVKFTRNL
jgi:hypothetical protein